MKRAIFNGKLVEEDTLKVGVLSPTVTSSYSVYETLRVINSRAVFLRDHLMRLKKSSDEIYLPLKVSEIEISEWIENLIKCEYISSAQLRITHSEEGIFITYSDLIAYPDSYYEDGVKCIYFFGERFMPTVKTSNRLLSTLAMKRAESKGAFEALLVNRRERVTEGTRTNFYAIADKSLYTAEDELVLSGVTRTRVIKIAKELGYKVIFEAPKYDDIKYFDSVFISSTSMAALPVSEIGDVKMKRDRWQDIIRIKDEIRKME